MKKFCIVLVALMTFSCENDQQKAVKRTSVYYDLMKLLDEQASLLAQSNAGLDKILSAGEESEQASLLPDQEGWKGEFAMFYMADINKLGLEEAYTVEKTSTSNGGYKTTNTAKSDDQTVRLITYHFDATSKLVSFTALIRDENLVYTFEKELTMWFEPFEKGVRMVSYRILGDQKMILKKELSFAIEGKVVYKMESPGM